jgi:hypothetical protein
MRAGGAVRLEAGARLRSAVCDTQVMVIAAPAGDLQLSCGGAPMLPLGTPPPAGAALAPDARGGTLIGKRYVDESGELELLCTRSGQGGLALGGVPLRRKEAKALPASD